ncbi:transforming growth factor beta receptor type 3-like isoform X1 [Haliotis rufescens]|uniref:transforming growth factor beta receptor type 3-like isoform X1 n=1 Tax=Haliotis rufescens TaxID=6454 RepID=UPI001EB09FB1|nr:transforming growth factor beta receptor type 3-like isoform X1 [Haliotis rufescens]
MLPPKYWISILLTLWITEVSDGNPQDRASKSKTKCVITSPFDSPFVKAHLMNYTMGKGCTTNMTSNKGQEVHVINVKVKEKRIQVNLRVEPMSILDPDIIDKFQRPLVFVLYSQLAVKWKVELVGLTSTTRKHLFVVPEHSSIRIKKSKLGRRVRDRKLKMPATSNRQELVSWTTLRYKAVTSYSELEGTSLLFRVGLVAGSGDECNITELGDSPHAVTSHIQAQPTAGCVSEVKKILMARPVYIIELLNEPPDSFLKRDTRMELEVTSVNNEPINKDFYLILKSPSSLKWAVRSRKVQGWIEIVTDADVDLKGIRMHTVALRREVMNATGLELIAWADYYLAPVEAYTQIRQANRIRLLISPNSKRVPDQHRWSLHDNPPGRSEGGIGPGSDGGDSPDHLKRAIHTQCKDGRMEISIPNNLLQENGLVKEQITLLNPLCGAVENSTHVILKTALNKCNTKYLQVDDENVFSNAIVIHSSEVTDPLMEEELGSAVLDNSEMSGSGSHDLTEATYVDDEDFHSHSMEIDVKCQVPLTTEPPSAPPQGGLDYQLQLYRNDLFLQSEHNTRMSMPRRSRLYVQASITAISHLDVSVLNCWVTPASTFRDKDASRIAIIRNGCPQEASVMWHNIPNSVPYGSLSVYRFSFQVRDYFLNNQHTYLHCQIAVCLKGPQAASSSIPKCVRDSERNCEQTSNIVGQFSTKSIIGDKLLVAGPWEVTGKDLQLPGGGTSDPKKEEENTSNNSGKSSNADKIEGSTQPQQSIIIEGLDSATVVGIAFAAFAIGILLTGALWFIHTHTGPAKQGVSSQGSAETSGESTPNSSSPISA